MDKARVVGSAKVIKGAVKQMDGEAVGDAKPESDGSARDAISQHQPWHQGRNKIKDSRTMNRNALYLIIGALAVVAVVLGYQFYQERQNTTGVDISVGKSGISIETK